MMMGEWMPCEQDEVTINETMTVCIQWGPNRPTLMRCKPEKDFGAGMYEPTMSGFHKIRPGSVGKLMVSNVARTVFNFVRNKDTDQLVEVRWEPMEKKQQMAAAGNIVSADNVFNGSGSSGLGSSGPPRRKGLGVLGPSGLPGSYGLGLSGPSGLPGSYGPPQRKGLGVFGSSGSAGLYGLGSSGSPGLGGSQANYLAPREIDTNQSQSPFGKSLGNHAAKKDIDTKQSPIVGLSRNHAAKKKIDTKQERMIQKVDQETSQPPSEQSNPIYNFFINNVERLSMFDNQKIEASYHGGSSADVNLGNMMISRK